MDETDDIPLSKSTKILFNLIEIRLFDLSQVLQVGGHKLSINQIKQALQKQYNIFGQVQKIFDELKINKLYDLIKQVSQNYVSIASILIDEKTSKNNPTKNKVENELKMNQEASLPKFQKIDKNLQKPKNSPRQSNRKRSILRTQQSIKSVEQINKTLQSLKAQQLQFRQKLGGIHLFNENYKRGVETLQQKHEAWQQKKRKNYGQKQLILELISKQISDQADVQKLYDNDEISKFIREGKVKHELYNHIEYEKDLESISSFLKQSQDDAMKFLMDTKKNKQDIESKDNEDEIVVNYHELVQMLVERKKTQYKAVENKIKQIVETFKFKLQHIEKQLLLKQANIRELQYKLKAKQGQQVGSQTVGLRSRFNKNSPDAIEQLEEQHKAVVELLKKNLDENQKDILLLETNVRISQEKLKKKQLQTNDLNVQLQKLRKQLKEQKQKNYNLKLLDSSFNNTPDNLSQYPIDSIIQSPEIQQNQQRQLSQQKISSHKKRKPKHSFFGILTSNNSLGSKLTKPIEQDNISKQNQVQQNDQRPITNNQTYKSSNFYNKKKTYKNDKSNQYETLRDQIQEKLIYNINQKKVIQQQQARQTRKGSPQQRNITSQSSSKHSTKYVQLRKEQRHGTTQFSNNSTKYPQLTKEQKYISNHSSKNSMRFTQATKGCNNQVQTRPDKQKDTKFNVEQNMEYKSGKKQNSLGQQANKTAQNSARILQNKSFTIKNTIKNGDQNKSKEINSINQKTTQIQDKQEKFANIDELLSNNSSKVYELLFKSISIEEKQPKGQNEIEELQDFLKKYNQNQLYSRLQNIFSLIHLSYKNAKSYNSVMQKQLSQQQNLIKSSYKDSPNSTKIKSPYIDTTKIPQFKEIFSNSQNLSYFRDIKANTDFEKWEKQQFIQLYKNNQIKDFTKNILTTKLLKKIHNQIRISGKGFNFTKKQFIQLCKNINLQESERKSQKSQDSQESYDQNYSPIKTQKAIASHKIKSSKNILKDKLIKRDLQSETHQKDKNLKIKGTGLEMSQQEGNQRSKINSFCTHQRKESQSMKNLFKHQTTQQQADNGNLIKVEKLQNIKKLASENSLNIDQNMNEIICEEPDTEEFKIEKNKQIEKFYKALKDKGAKIQSLKKLEEAIQNNKISLKDLIKITALILAQKPHNLSKILAQGCDQFCKIQNKLVGCSSKSCCTHHIKKYSSFLEKLSLNQQWLKKIKKQVFAMHILNIDGGEQTRNDFYKKKLSKQNSIVRMNLTTNNSQTILQSIQKQSFYSSSKKNDQIVNNRQALKKNVFSTHFELKQKKLNFETKNKPKNVDSVSFLPQLANKPTSQLIKN